MSRKHNDNTFHIACALGLVFGLTIAIAFVDPDLETFWAKVKLTDWLSFIGALLGAALTVVGAFIVTRRAEKEKERRELDGARSILSSDLSSIIEHTEVSAAICFTIVEALHFGKDKAHIDIPKIDTAILLRLARLIVLASPDVSKALSELLHEIQVQQARLSGQIDQFNGKTLGRTRGLLQHSHSPITAIQSTIYLYAQAENLFDYARKKSEAVEKINYDTKAFGRIMFSLGLNDLADPSVTQRLQHAIVGFIPPS